MDAHIMNPAGLTSALFLINERNRKAEIVTGSTFICNVGPGWKAREGELLDEPVATQFFTVEQLKAERLRGLYRIGGARS